MGKTIRASVLILLLACSASAGHMQNDVTGTPPPPPSAPQETQPADDNAPDEEPEGLTETVLNLLQSVLALL